MKKWFAMNPYSAFVVFSVLLISSRVTCVNVDAPANVDSDAVETKTADAAETTSLSFGDNSSHFDDDDSSAPRDGPLNDLDFDSFDESESDLSFLDSSPNDGHLQHLVTDDVDEIDAKEKISSPTISSLPVTNGQKVPAPVSSPPGKFSTPKKDGQKDGLRVQKCCPLGQVALGSMLVTPGADEESFSCVERPDSLDPDWDWLGSVRKIREGETQVEKRGSGSEDEEKEEEQLWKSFEEVYPVPKLNTTFGVPDCQHYR